MPPRRRPIEQSEAPETYRDATRGERLQRVMADAGVASRRDCEAMIEAGRVEVNGHLVKTLPAWVDPMQDRIQVDGRPLPPREKHVYLLLNKPTRTLTSARDEPGSDRPTVIDLVDHPWRAKLFPVGRLDFDTVGLVLLTNDGELANRLTHPRYGVPKTYRAVVKGRVQAGAMEQLEQGIYLANRREGKTDGVVKTSRVEIQVVHVESDKTTIDITLYEGRNRQVRRMLAAVDLPVRKLERTAMGPVRLKGVARGMWRELTAMEVSSLRRACGMQKSRPGKAGTGGKTAAANKPGGQGRPAGGAGNPGRPRGARGAAGGAAGGNVGTGRSPAPRKLSPRKPRKPGGRG